MLVAPTGHSTPHTIDDGTILKLSVNAELEFFRSSRRRRASRQLDIWHA